MAIFDNDKPQETPEPSTPQPETPTEQPVSQNQFDQLLDQIRGDDDAPKYRDVPTALNALQHSQKYIQELKQELAELREKANSNVTMEQVLSALEKKSENKTEPEPPTPSGLSPEDVLRLMEEREMKKQQEANINSVDAKFHEVYGEKAAETFKEKAKELGLSMDYLKTLSATSPKAVFTLFGIGSTKPASPSIPSGINTAGMPRNEESPIKPVMGYTTDKELADSWRRVKEKVNNQLGIK